MTDTATETTEAPAHTHNDEPHTHTITFTDNAGMGYSFDVDCPDSDGLTTMLRGLDASGADSVNELAVDGNPMSFEGVIIRLGVMDRLAMLGKSYQTPENLIRLLVAMGAPEPAADAND